MKHTHITCIVNISEGQDEARLSAFRQVVDGALLDVHADPHHNRSVFSLGGPHVGDAALALATAAVDALSLTTHQGVHPRLGVVDVVPFVPVPKTGTTLDAAMVRRAAFCAQFVAARNVPCFLYGDDVRQLPEVRTHAFVDLVPDVGSHTPHATAGAACVGARHVLIAYNLWLATTELDIAKDIARTIRRPGLRSLALAVGDAVQVSCNLTAPGIVGPADAFDAVSELTPVVRAELVGLLPDEALRVTPSHRWAELGIGPENTIEARLQQTGLDGGR